MLSVDVFTALKVSGGPFEEKIGTEFINGVPEEYAEELKKRNQLKAMSHTRN